MIVLDAKMARVASVERGSYVCAPVSLVSHDQLRARKSVADEVGKKQSTFRPRTK